MQYTPRLPGRLGARGGGDRPTRGAHPRAFSADMNGCFIIFFLFESVVQHPLLSRLHPRYQFLANPT